MEAATAAETTHSALHKGGAEEKKFLMFPQDDFDGELRKQQLARNNLLSTRLLEQSRKRKVRFPKDEAKLATVKETLCLGDMTEEEFQQSYYTESEIHETVTNAFSIAKPFVFWKCKRGLESMSPRGSTKSERAIQEATDAVLQVQTNIEYHQFKAQAGILENFKPDYDLEEMIASAYRKKTIKAAKEARLKAKRDEILAYRRSSTY
eukprot:CAMPEP_0116846238 /NCGR_PEP_ID=MMETSP0418-20121206/13722_1 /TAXON_ID=1158023 /ORGANISM="Astrosyne radiata, Strain 13vi08-1A" /LENGTH=206 /DNA_ID=CAMNT_0004477459 /DNA_START=32 /DNA_END=652 /DNA_ORIENTATION=-